MQSCTPNYIDVNKRMKILDTGKLSLDAKEINLLELLVKRMSAGKAHFTSNVMAIVGEGKRKAEINVFGNKIRTTIPRHVDKIVKTHNTISQDALNALLFAWVYGSSTGDNPPLYVAGGTGSITFTISSGTTYSFTPLVASLYNGSNTYTFIFVVNDESTNSYTTTQQQLFPYVLYPYNTQQALQLSVPLSTANLVLSKSSNQIFTYLWAIQVNFSSTLDPYGEIAFFYPPGLGTGSGYGNYFCASTTTYGKMAVYTPTTMYFNAPASYYFLNVNGILYAVAIATDSSTNSYTPDTVSAPYWGYSVNTCNPAYLSFIVTSPNPPGTKVAYQSVSWYNGIALTA